MHSDESRRRIITTQRTSKYWKAGMVIGVILMIVGVGRLIINTMTPTEHGMLFTAAGLIIFLTCRVAAFWFHD